MELETLKETLVSALNIQGKSVSAKSNIPVLSNVLLKAEGTKLYLYTTNLEQHTVSWIGANAIKSGSTTVALKRFLEYINTLPEGQVTLKLVGTELQVISKNSKANFTTIAPEEFPKIGDIKDEALCTINSIKFFDSVNDVAFSASKDDTRPTFTGVYVEINQSYIDFVAIDGFRLSKKRLETETGVTNQISFIVPSSYIEEIAKLGGEKDEDIKLYVMGNKNQLGIRYKNSDFVIRLIDGVYPDYTRVIPHEFTTTCVVDRQLLLDAVKTSSIFSSQKEIAKTQVEVSSGQITLRSFQKEIGENETKIDCEIKGDEGTITYNSKFLQDIVGHLDTNKIVIKVVLNQDKPSVFYNSKNNKEDSFDFEDSYFSLMTPIKIDKES